MKEFDVVPLAPLQLLGRFSGGNQQKAILAKWLQLNPPLVLLDEPTHGVDVGAKRDLLDRLVRTASNGAGVVISSVEYEDLATICDRVIVFRHGAIAAELSQAELSKESIAAACYSA
jgi:ribose transport system ATP-binding protein